MPGRLVLGISLALGPVNLDLWAGSSPLSPDEAPASFESERGLRVELVAAEPFTVAPCAVAWDERGRLFVAENRGYPTGGPNGKAVGVIAMLEDTNGDGRCDKRTEFATGLSFPNGLMSWRGGLIVTCAPDVFYFKDTDSDGRADVKEVLLTGFATNQSTQLRVNKPMLALDGWVYLASGLSGGKITSPKRPNAPPLELKGDLRFKPDTGEYELIDGKSQFGQSFDDFGRRFGVFNRVQVQHFVLPSRYLERNPHLPSPGVLQNCPELLDNPFMRGGSGAARIYPISANVTTADSHAGTFTAACAIHLWRGGALPIGYNGDAFTCDPTGNLVHHDRLEASGATFAARRIGENVEFLRSRDDWFRPVFLATGPDGALYVCDMYRKTIEHPEYLPGEVRKRTDFESGKDMGRIWRVVDANRAKSVNVRPQPPASLSIRALVAELESPNSWRRDTAFRLLVERRDGTAVKYLRRGLARLASAPAVASRLHLLAVFGALDETTLLVAMNSTNSGVREVALKLAEPFLDSSTNLQRRVVKLAGDADARVRFQCALALGAFGRASAMSVESLEALTHIALCDQADKWTRAAVLSSTAGRERELLSALLHIPGTSNRAAPDLFIDLGRVLARATPSGQSAALLNNALSADGWTQESLFAFLAGFSETKPEALRSFASSTNATTWKLREAFTAALKAAADTSAAPTLRRHAITLLVASDNPAVVPTLLEPLRAGEPPELQTAAVRALVQSPHSAGVVELLSPKRWSSYAPALRTTVLGALVSRPEHHGELLDALESGAVPVSALDSSRREQLKRSKDDAVRQRAEKLFATVGSGDRAKAFTETKACLALKPDPANGREVFKRLCASCHRLDREGIAVGPDLFDIRNQPKESILLHIVIPEQEIAPNFANYVCETKDGRTVSGLIAAETPLQVTFRQAQGVEETIARNDITSLTASPLSLMPQELEKGMTTQEMADLLGYLKGEGN
jgi:putative membrane-bound dehydrogenase-like protein